MRYLEKAYFTAKKTYNSRTCKADYKNIIPATKEKFYELLQRKEQLIELARLKYKW